MKLLLIILLLLFSYSQTMPNSSNIIDQGLKIGELLINGISLIKPNYKQNDFSSSNLKNTASSKITNVCFKNKLTEKLVIKLQGKFNNSESENIEFKKELVVQNNSQECLYDLYKGVWDYEILKPNNELFKKGQILIDKHLYTIEDN